MNPLQLLCFATTLHSPATLPDSSNTTAQWVARKKERETRKFNILERFFDDFTTQTFPGEKPPLLITESDVVSLNKKSKELVIKKRD